MTTALTTALKGAKKAPLPTSYERAREALQKCFRIDECKDWSDKAKALASYAKQADDKTLFQTAMKINGRAVRRVGELLDEIEPSKTGPKPKRELGVGTHTQSQTRESAAKAAGLSRHQQVQAQRIAKIPERDFEKALGATKPPTLTALANQGKKPKPSTAHLQGRKPEEFNAAIHLRGDMKRFAEHCKTVTPAAAVRGSLDKNYADMRQWAKTILRWTEQAQQQLEKRR